VMLTSKWSRFNWDDIIGGKFPTVRYSPEQALMQGGRVFIVKGNLRVPLTNGEIPMMIRGQNGTLENILSVPVDIPARISYIIFQIRGQQ